MLVLRFSICGFLGSHRFAVPFSPFVLSRFAVLFSFLGSFLANTYDVLRETRDTRGCVRYVEVARRLRSTLIASRVYSVPWHYDRRCFPASPVPRILSPSQPPFRLGSPFFIPYVVDGSVLLRSSFCIRRTLRSAPAVVVSPCPLSFSLSSFICSLPHSSPFVPLSRFRRANQTLTRVSPRAAYCVQRVRLGGGRRILTG